MLISGSLEGKVPVVDDVLSSHEREIYPTTSLDENIIEVKLKTDRNYYVDLRQTFLALKFKLIKDHGYDFYNAKESIKNHKTESKQEAAENTADREIEKDPPVPLVNNVNNILR